MTIRNILLTLLAVVAVSGVALWYAATSAFRSLGEAFGFSAQVERVFFLQDLPEGEVAVLLNPILTGGEPLLVRDAAAIQAARDQAYVMDKTGGGEGFGTFMLAMLGGQNMQPVLTVFVDRAVHNQIQCNFNQCRDGAWINADFGHDIGALAEAGEPVDLVGEVHWDYEAYRAAFEAIANDPDIFFTFPGQETLAPPASTQHSFRLLLPSDLQLIGPSVRPDAFNSSEELEPLNTILEEAFAGLPVTITQVAYNVDDNPYLTGPDGMNLPGSGPAIQLIGYALVTPNIVLNVPESEIDALQARVAETNWPTPDQSLFSTAITTYLAEQGQADCQPDCEVDGARRVDTAELNPFARPSWDLRVWQIQGTP